MRHVSSVSWKWSNETTLRMERMQEKWRLRIHWVRASFSHLSRRKQEAHGCTWGGGACRGNVRVWCVVQRVVLGRGGGLGLGLGLGCPRTHWLEFKEQIPFFHQRGMVVVDEGRMCCGMCRTTITTVAWRLWSMMVMLTLVFVVEFFKVLERMREEINMRGMRRIHMRKRARGWIKIKVFLILLLNLQNAFLNCRLRHNSQFPLGAAVVMMIVVVLA